MKITFYLTFLFFFINQVNIKLLRSCRSILLFSFVWRHKIEVDHFSNLLNKGNEFSKHHKRSVSNLIDSDFSSSVRDSSARSVSFASSYHLSMSVKSIA